MISHKYKTIFIHINKTAGTSVETAFNIDTSIADKKHLTAKQIKKRVGIEIWDSYFKFSIVRNPWDKMVSMYHHRKQNSKKESLPHKLEFQIWIKNLPYIKKKIKNTTNQIDWLMDDYGTIIIDYIIRFEDLISGWNIIKEKCNIETDLPWVNRSIHSNYREYYDDESIEIISKRFNKDIDFFGYKF